MIENVSTQLTVFHNVLPTACFPEGPSPHFTFCSFWRRRPRLEAVIYHPTVLSNSLDPDKARHFVGSDLDPNSFQRLLAGNKNCH